jgi:cytoskeletal protein CcmA (bactofilin family)
MRNTMWNRHRETETTAPPATVPSPPPPRIEPRPAIADARSDAPALIGPELSIIGEVRTEQDLHIAGRVEGPVYCSDAAVCVLATGEVRGAVHAREVILYGRIDGDVVAKTRLNVRQDARLTGNVSCAAIMIEETAYFKGSIDIVRQGDVKQAPSTAANPARREAAAG